MIDLHMHSLASDGSQTPEEIIRACRDAGLALCAVTDHDNIDAQARAQEESRRLGQPYLTGIEFSVRYTGELHILGYGMDLSSPAFSQMMAELRKSRVERIACIVRDLQTHGLNISLEDVVRQSRGTTLGRPHVALALAEKGYAADFHEAFSKYLDEGGLCYVRRRKLTAQQAITLIREAGGLAVLAHPGLIHTGNLPRLIRQLTAYGLAGIEAYYPAHTDAQCCDYEKLAGELGLLVTCGSDSHGIYRTNAIGCEKRNSSYLEQSAARLLKLAVSS